LYTLEERVYRPPVEAASILLEVSLGCSYGKCTFCQYADGKTPLQLISPEILGDNLAEMAKDNVQGNRMYLLGGNVLAFKTRYLLDVFQYVQGYLPAIRQFAMYGRADDVLHKSDRQLTALKDAGLHTVYIGVESGKDTVLKNIRKGETRELILRALHKLDEIGIAYGLSSILGLGGPDLWKEHSLATASFYNQVRPASIRVMTLTVMAGTPLEKAVQEGSFRLMDPRDVLKEEILLLENIHYDSISCWFTGSHVSNSVPVEGYIPEDQKKMIDSLRHVLDKKEAIQKSDLTAW
jgi:radical SAM superfamily enzyme YgiQ (UPF0313 family)